jgi:hypothetical protein
MMAFVQLPDAVAVMVGVVAPAGKYFDAEEKL